MVGRKCNLAFLLICGTTALSACGGVSTNVQNAPAPPSTPIAIVFQPAPPVTIHISGTTTLTAVVSNDPSNAGVDWSLTCQPAGNCGSLNPPHNASGQPVTYAAPATLSSNSQTVTIAAFATADHTKNTESSMTVTAFGSVLMGTYVIQTHGVDVFGQPYQRAGMVTLDGNGGIASGEQTVDFVNPNTGTYSSVQDPIVGGSYFVGSDGRGTLAINTNDVNVGQQGIETFSMVVLSGSRVLLSERDNPNLQGSSGESSVGTGDLQTATPTPAHGYAFVTNGTDTFGSTLALGGVFNVDSPRVISGIGSAFDLVDSSNGPGVVSPSTSVSGTVSAPDSFGAFQVSLVTDFGTFQFTGYPIDAIHLQLIESDGVMGLTVGQALSQGSATGTYKTEKTFTGNYVFGLFGRDTTLGSASLAAAGIVSTAGKGALTSGYIDESQAGNSVQISDGFRAVYAVGPGSNPLILTDPAGTGRFYIPLSTTTGFPNFTFSNSSNGTGPAWVFYLTGNGGPALMLDADIEPSLFSNPLGSGGGVATGIAYPMVAGASFSGSFGTIFTQKLLGSEDDVAGEIYANGNSLSGIVDINTASGPLATDDNSLSGSFQNSPVHGRLRGTLSDAFFFNDLGTTNLSMAFYPIDSSQGFFVENDLTDSSGTPVSGDLTFGYYAAQIPVCQGCP